MSYHRTDSAGDALARGMGWFSIGLGLAELLGGHRMARWMGMEKNTELLRAYGVREIVTGIGLLGQSDARPWIWGRIAGDMLDLATLAPALTEDHPRRDNVRLALMAVAGATAVDLVCIRMLDREDIAEMTVPRDYSNRSGLPGTPDAMRGAARSAPVPKDLRTPDILRFQPAATA